VPVVHEYVICVYFTFFICNMNDKLFLSYLTYMYDTYLIYMINMYNIHVISDM